MEDGWEAMDIAIRVPVVRFQRINFSCSFCCSEPREGGGGGGFFKGLSARGGTQSEIINPIVIDREL